MAKILHVDSDPDVLERVRGILEGAGYEVVSASKSLEGLEKVEAEKPDLVLIEVMMPEISGWDFFERIRETGPKVAFLTSMECSIGRKEELIAYGLSDYILKPIALDELGEILVGRIKAILEETTLEEKIVEETTVEESIQK